MQDAEKEEKLSYVLLFEMACIYSYLLWSFNFTMFGIRTIIKTLMCLNINVHGYLSSFIFYNCLNSFSFYTI